MNFGMLWFDNSAASFGEKVGKAAKYYLEKYGKAANLCFVHPADALDEPEVVGDVSIKSSKQVLRNHFWLGVEQR